MERLYCWLVVGCLLLGSWLVPGGASADSDLRDYEALGGAPNSTFVGFAYFRHSGASDNELDLSQDLGGLRATYILRFGNLVVVPFDLSLYAVDVRAAISPTITLHSSGYTDPEFFPTIAYVISEGPGAHTVLAFNPRLDVPLGTYDNTRLLNIGQNRITFKPQLAVAQRFATVFSAELVANMAFHTSNDEFVVPGAMPGLVANTTMQADPDLVVDAHLAVDLSPTFFLGASYYFLKTGEAKLTSLGNVLAAPSETTHSLRVSFGVRLEPNTLLLLQASQDLSATNVGISRFAGIRIAHVFWGGSRTPPGMQAPPPPAAARAPQAAASAPTPEATPGVPGADDSI